MDRSLCSFSLVHSRVFHAASQSSVSVSMLSSSMPPGSVGLLEGTMGGEGNMDFALTFLDFSVISFRFLGELF